MALLPTQVSPVKRFGVPTSVFAGGNISPEHKAAIYRERDQGELLKAILSISENKADLFVRGRGRLKRSYEILRIAEHYLLKEYDQLYGN